MSDQWDHLRRTRIFDDRAKKAGDALRNGGYLVDEDSTLDDKENALVNFLVDLLHFMPEAATPAGKAPLLNRAADFALDAYRGERDSI